MLNLVPFRSRRLVRSDDLFDEIEREMERVFEDVVGRRSLASFVPSMDIREGKDAIEVLVEVPGMSKDDIELSIEDNSLYIRGEKKLERTEKDDDTRYHLIERRYGRFERSINLPGAVDAKKAKAEFKDGVLKITFPKKEEAKSIKLKIS